MEEGLILIFTLLKTFTHSPSIMFTCHLQVIESCPWVWAVGNTSLVKVQLNNHENKRWEISLWIWKKSDGLRDLAEPNTWHMKNDPGKY